VRFLEPDVWNLGADAGGVVAVLRGRQRPGARARRRPDPHDARSERGAHVDPAGHWKIRKVKQSHKIDGLVASVIAYSRAARTLAEREPLFAWV
jgi:hypothetical protein